MRSSGALLPVTWDGCPFATLCRLNMAALLRSARALNLSASPLLQIKRTSNHRQTISRFYSRTVGGRGIGVCSRQIISGSFNPAMLVWEHAVVARDEPSLGVRNKQSHQFDWALAKLDSSVRRTGRVTKSLLQRIFHDICRTGYPSGNQALLLLRSCGSLLPELPLAERTEFAHHIWGKLLELGAAYDVSHYNALLKVYLQNEFKFSPTEFLAKMEAANVQPNRVTYQRLIAAYCQVGDIEGASKVLGFMKSKDLPITEAVFNSLVTGHSRAGDMESAVNILSVMRGTGIDPGPDTYLALLVAYAEKGDMDKIKETLNQVENTDISLMDRDLMQVVFTLTVAGHQQHVPEVLEHLRHDGGFVPDAMNLCLSLITQGHESTAFMLLKTFPSVQADSQNSNGPDVGNFFLRHCVNTNKSPEELVGFCKGLMDSNLHAAPMQFTLYCALEAKKMAPAIEVMKTMKEEGLPIRPHYFWPLLAQHKRDQNTAGTLEVLKAMQELSTEPDIDTYCNYVLRTFPSVDSARTALADAGIAVDTIAFVSAEVRAEAAEGNLARLFAFLSSPSLPAIDIGVFRGNLIAGFKRQTSTENMAYFLYHLFDGMSETEVQAKEEVLREYLQQLHKKGICIPVNIYRGIRNILDSHHVPELIKVPLLCNFLLFCSHLKCSKTIKCVCVFSQNLPRALELKAEHEDKMSPSCYALLINLCCRHDNPEEALNLKRELARMDSEATLDVNKYMSLLRVLSKHNRLEEAVDILKEMKEKDVVVKDTAVVLLFHTFSAVALRGDVAALRRLQDTTFALGLAKPTSNLCSPMVTMYLEKGDFAGALEAVMECETQYHQLPRIHDVLCGIVKKGDTELLQKAMDFVSQQRGEMTVLYDLFFAFLQTGRYREARKIIETPGLRAKPGRLQWYAEKCIGSNQMEALETMVDLTAKLFECDRDEMYHYLLCLCKDTNDWSKAEAVWTKMQEENVIPRERTLRLLADIFKTNNQEVPFEVPEVKQPSSVTAFSSVAYAVLYTSRSSAGLRGLVMALCKKRKVQEAYNVLKEAERLGKALVPACYDALIKALLSSGSMEDAMAVKDIAANHITGFQLSDMAHNLQIITQVKQERPQGCLKTMLQMDQVPSQLALTRLVQGLGNHGDIKGIQEVASLIKSLSPSLNMSSMLFVNNMALAHIKNGDLERALEDLESLYTQTADHSQQSIAFVFRKVVEAHNDEAFDKLRTMAERLCHQFASYKPATDLFLQCLDTGRVEEARQLLQRCAAVAEQKTALVSYMAKASQSPGQIAKIKNLLELIPDFAEKELVYAYMMKCHGKWAGQVGLAAKALYRRMQAEGLQMNELSLKRLAQLYKKAGEPVPFEEPPETFKFYADKLKASTLPSPEDD
uniref:PROP1-like PPR domain-containing protein n=1 Tax=Electrophorus electricus TaxID=8005 RepID=A0A4W4ERN2_ELEEL